MMNAYHGDLDFRFPRARRRRSSGKRWSIPPSRAGCAKDGRLWQPGEVYQLRGHSFALFINRAPEAPAIARAEEALTEFDCTGPKADQDAPPS